MSEKERIDCIEQVLISLIAWMAQSANAPLRLDEARTLLMKLEKRQP